MIRLGQKGRDILTGFQGLCIAKATYLTGCNQVQLLPTSLSDDGKRREGEWFDEQRVKPLNDEILVLDNDEGNGRDESLPPG